MYIKFLCCVSFYFLFYLFLPRMDLYALDFLSIDEVNDTVEENEVIRLLKAFDVIEKWQLFTVEGKVNLDSKKPTVVLIPDVHAGSNLALSQKDDYIYSKFKQLHLFDILGIDADIQPFFIENNSE